VREPITDKCAFLIFKDQNQDRTPKTGTQEYADQRATSTGTSCTGSFHEVGSFLDEREAFMVPLPQFNASE
jgi:hypothetical protein